MLPPGLGNHPRASSSAPEACLGTAQHGFVAIGQAFAVSGASPPSADGPSGAPLMTQWARSLRPGTVPLSARWVPIMRPGLRVHAPMTYTQRHRRTTRRAATSARGWPTCPYILQQRDDWAALNDAASAFTGDQSESFQIDIADLALALRPVVCRRRENNVSNLTLSRRCVLHVILLPRRCFHPADRRRSLWVCGPIMPHHRLGMTS
jgi:hypothetical protein